MEQNDLAHLVCGNFQHHQSLEDMYKVLFNKIGSMETRLYNLVSSGTEEDLTVLGPYFARNILETTCSILIGRIDPYRLIYVQKVQSLEFSINSKSKSAISWAGDVFGKDKNSKNKLWDSEKEYNSDGRAMLSLQYGEIYWNPAYKKLIDDTDYLTDASLENYRMRIESPENFIKYLRSECSSLYSSLSKGVHSELVMDSAIIYDKSTVIDLIYRTFKMCSTLGMVSHYIDLSICTIDKNTAFEYYRKIYDWSEEEDE